MSTVHNKLLFTNNHLSHAQNGIKYELFINANNGKNKKIEKKDQKETERKIIFTRKQVEFILISFIWFGYLNHAKAQ